MDASIGHKGPVHLRKDGTSRFLWIRARGRLSRLGGDRLVPELGSSNGPACARMMRDRDYSSVSAPPIRTPTQHLRTPARAKAS
jgi:hypothetical protein